MNPSLTLAGALVLGTLALPVGTLRAPLPAAGQAPAPRQEPVSDDVRQALEKEGIVLDRELGVLSIPATVLIKNDLLEYLLVGPHGAAHESLFLTQVRPSLLNAAMLLLGVEPGRNAYREETGGVDEKGRPNVEVHPPDGDGFFLYAAWREQGETYFFRVEDLLRNLESGRSLRRHRWVYLGSRFQALKPGASESFLADIEGNLINLSFFFQGNTLLSAALPECYVQTIWAANEWLLPERGAPLRLVFAREPLATLPPALAAALPEAVVPAAAGGDSR
jgi:hypothetical protein